MQTPARSEPMREHPLHARARERSQRITKARELFPQEQADGYDGAQSCNLHPQQAGLRAGL